MIACSRRYAEHGSPLRHTLFLVIALSIAGCAGLPPGADYAKQTSNAIADPETTRLGAQIALAGRAHPGLSGFRIVPVGVDGFLTRAQIIASAERTLDLQYYIFHGDETGRLLSAELLRAADRGVRIRILIDDGETRSGDERVINLDAHPNIEVRVFNPFVIAQPRPARRACQIADRFAGSRTSDRP